jgi:hypothetical protein
MLKSRESLREEEDMFMIHCRRNSRVQNSSFTSLRFALNLGVGLGALGSNTKPGLVNQFNNCTQMNMSLIV